MVCLVETGRLWAAGGKFAFEKRGRGREARWGKGRGRTGMVGAHVHHAGGEGDVLVTRVGG